MKVIIMHQTVTNHDAIGNDIAAMYAVLQEKYECIVFAENRLNSGLSYIDEDNVKDLLGDQNNLVFYHHSVFWEKGEALLKNTRAKIIFRYHNITPPHFFEPYNEFHTAQCSKGREQTNRLVEQFPEALWLCDSEYNSNDIAGVEKERIQICPPFHKIENWASGLPDERIMKELLYSRAINLLFVGRVAPNKGHLFLLDVLQAFRTNYSEEICLWIIGKFDDGLPGYNQLIEEKIAQYGLRNNIRFVGEITDATMSAYYLGCDAYVCASEHEGFCVPIVESQYFKLPILAMRSSAVPETMGANQVVLGNDPKEYAAAIHLLAERQGYRKLLRDAGRKNYDQRFSATMIERAFLRAMKFWNIM